MKALMFLTLIMILPLGVLADRWTMPIERVALEADIIVRGEIVQVNSGTYDFRVVEKIKGASDSILTIRPTNQGPCDIRYADFETGQHLVVFLEKVDGQLKIINGSTGEIPIINNQITLFYEQTFDAKEFVEGIKQFVAYLKPMSDGKGGITYELIQTCTEAELKSFKTSSKFSAWLYDRVLRSYEIDQLR